ncbi:maleylpyruvate isomerase family mycothiol-dependent enzyme [Actinomadura viridis]|uniref:Maleylpyruvate isomerase n=1 Tax=Actinomadura viridis TaxID=58110 RepID=A0A931GKC8_9ACTN|nr:maleylpyruvate isomerase family mycothiol-dependent enzyme [Actinomadura viridis]MBG6090182.1 maleylpyruvate isomerase [Actinomadura viridis]
MSEWPGAVPEVLAEVDAGTARIVATLEELSDEDMRAPSALPGWTRGHVATHIARNADSLWNLLEWARTGVRIPQYPSMEARNAALEEGAGRGAKELVRDVRETAERFSMQAASLPPEAREVTVEAMAGFSHPAWYTVYRRWHEVEAHHADLAAGYGPARWPAAYVQWALPATLADLEALPEGLRGGLNGHRLLATETGDAADLGGGAGAPRICGSGRAMLGWLTGRSSGEGLVRRPEGPLPVPPPWPQAPARF